MQETQTQTRYLDLLSINICISLQRLSRFLQDVTNEGENRYIHLAESSSAKEISCNYCVCAHHNSRQDIGCIRSCVQGKVLTRLDLALQLVAFPCKLWTLPEERTGTHHEDAPFHMKRAPQQKLSKFQKERRLQTTVAFCLLSLIFCLFVLLFQGLTLHQCEAS